MSKTGVIKIQNEREIINISSDSFNIYYIIQKYVTVVSLTSITIEIFLSFIARIVPTLIFVGMRRFFLNLGAIRDAKKHVFFKPCFLCEKEKCFFHKKQFFIVFFVFFNYRKIFN